jgi:hypothetical protein
LIGVAIIAIATGQGIGAAYRALIMAMHMYQLYDMSAKKTVLHSLTIAYPCTVSGIEQEVGAVAETEI